MEADRIQLTIEGEPDEPIRLIYRGDRDSEEPPPVVFEGSLGGDGRVTLPAPRAYLVILSNRRHGAIPVPLHEEPPGIRTRTIRLAEVDSPSG